MVTVQYTVISGVQIIPVIKMSEPEGWVWPGRLLFDPNEGLLWLMDDVGG